MLPSTYSGSPESIEELRININRAGVVGSLVSNDMKSNMIVIPLILAFGLLAISHLAGGCGAGSSGGCEMGAASVGIFAAPFAFVIGAAFSVIRSTRKSQV